jgi:uncharacterized protein (DUF1697 family)
MTQYLALLRGINVGGNNIIKMKDLKACFESMGLVNVTTYIQSGNVIFSSASQDKSALTRMIETKLSTQFDYKSTVLLISQSEMTFVVESAPAGFGTNNNEYRYDVLFLIPPFTVEQVLQGISARDGVDQVWSNDAVIYFSRLISKAGSSYLNKIVGTSTYKQMTIRNWNTSSKLLELMNSTA